MYLDQDGKWATETDSLYNTIGPRGQSSYIRYVKVFAPKNDPLKAYASTSTAKGYSIRIRAGLIQKLRNKKRNCGESFSLRIAKIQPANRLLQVAPLQSLQKMTPYLPVNEIQSYWVVLWKST